MVGDSFLPGANEPFPSRLSDRLGAPGVLVVESDVPDAGMQPDRVVVDPLTLQLDLKLDGVAGCSRCGDSPLRWEKNDSTGAWSVGTPGRPK